LDWKYRPFSVLIKACGYFRDLEDFQNLRRNEQPLSLRNQPHNKVDVKQAFISNFFGCAFVFLWIFLYWQDQRIRELDRGLEPSI
jgi:hypothetical protein